MTNTQDLEHAVSLTLGDHVEDFDIPAIVSDLITTRPTGRLENIDEVPPAEYWEIVQMHDRTEAP